MNGASEPILARAIHAAGAMPSIYMPCEHNHQYAALYRVLRSFYDDVGNNHLVLAIEQDHLLDDRCLRILTDLPPSHLELFPPFGTKAQDMNDQLAAFTGQVEICQALDRIKTKSKIIARICRPCHDITDIDAYGVKGNDAAGFSGSAHDTASLCGLQKLSTPQKALIAYGGVATPHQVQSYVTMGMAAVAVGTLFAAAQESCLDTDTKNKMIAANSSDLIRFTDTKQRALVLGDPAAVINDQTYNRHASLSAGIAGRGGHIYASGAIDHIHGILPVKDIVEYLVADLPQRSH